MSARTTAKPKADMFTPIALFVSRENVVVKRQFILSTTAKRFKSQSQLEKDLENVLGKCLVIYVMI